MQPAGGGGGGLQLGGGGLKLNTGLGEPYFYTLLLEITQHHHFAYCTGKLT